MINSGKRRSGIVAELASGVVRRTKSYRSVTFVVNSSESLESSGVERVERSVLSMVRGKRGATSTGGEGSFSMRWGGLLKEGLTNTGWLCFV